MSKIKTTVIAYRSTFDWPEKKNHRTFDASSQVKQYLKMYCGKDPGFFSAGLWHLNTVGLSASHTTGQLSRNRRGGSQPEIS